MQDEKRFTVRLPGPIATWLFSMKEREGSTTNFEIIRSIRERMDRDAKTVFEGGATPPKTSPEQ